MERIVEEVAGVSTEVWVAGRGPAVVLLHGSADTPLAWQAVAEILAARFEVWAPALPARADGLAIEGDLPWLGALLARSEARVLAGHSYGALLALRWALAHPGALDRLVLAEPIAWGVGRDLPAFAPRLAELEERCLARFAAGAIEPAMEWLVDYWNGAGFWARLPDKVRAALRAGAPRTGAEVASGAADRTSAAELAGLAVPTSVIAGAASTAESLAVSRRIASAVPDARLTVLAGAGHQFLRTHPAEVAAACAGQFGRAGTAGGG